VSIIYKITNMVTGKIYIGRTSQSLLKRWTQHKRGAQRAGNTYLFASIRKYGADSFVVDEIEKCPDEIAGERERHYVAVYRSLAPAGYNLTLGGEGNLGLKRSLESKSKISAALKGRRKSPEHVANHRAALLGRVGENKGRCFRVDLLDDEIVRAYESGEACSSIAKRLNSNPHTIRWRLKRSGVWNPKPRCSSSS